MSADLQWLLLRKNNSFIVNRTVEGPIFSTEPGNLTNIHSFKYSGIANPKAIGVKPTSESAGITLTIRDAAANPRQIQKSMKTINLKTSTGPRKIAKIIAAETAGKGYRADLRPAAIARASAIAAAQKETRSPKEVKAKKPRHKAPKATEAPAAEESA